MGSFEWIISGITVFLGMAGAACAAILPILILAGLGFFIYRRSQQSAAYRQTAQGWPSTTGMVLASNIQIRRTSRSRSEIPVVVYQYQVNGQAYQNQIIRAGDHIGTIRVAGQARATVARYPIGSTVTVYYNPANPAESALER